jgi:hypothetical protein
MLNSNGSISQTVLYNNKEIYWRIEKELLQAQHEILVATAWFTDSDLFEILRRKLTEKVKVEIILTDNAENNKLHFDELALAGASVIRIKNAGQGIMHQKFCLIDGKLALHGSYNWTVNARKNNQESIIVTDHPETVESLVGQFREMKLKAMNTAGKDGFFSKLLSVFNKKNEQGKSAHHTVDGSEPDSGKTTRALADSPEREYEKVLDSMIDAEVGNFDRDVMRKQGYTRAQSNNGDHQVLNNAFDSVFSVLLNEVDIVEDKKQRLLGKLEEQKTRRISLLREKVELSINSINSKYNSEEENLNRKITGLKAEIQTKTRTISGIRENDIKQKEREIDDLQESFKTIEQETVRPKFRWYEFIPTTLIVVLLFVYLFVFYSSAAYILIFSEGDAKAARLQGIEIAPPEVFNPEALSKAMENGGSSILFVILFTIIPISFALLKLFMKSTVWAWLLSVLVGFLMVDGAIAYKVAESIHEVNYLIGNADTVWRPNMVFSDTNFWLVFIFGALGLLLLKLSFEKFMNFFRDRDPDLKLIRDKKTKTGLAEKIAGSKKSISDLNTRIVNLETELIESRKEIEVAEVELTNLPARRSLEIEKYKVELSHNEQSVERITEIYKSHIENNNIPLSVDLIKDRISIFLEGWNDYLHEEYAVKKAVEKSRLATDAALSWQEEKLKHRDLNRNISKL